MVTKRKGLTIVLISIILHKTNGSLLDLRTKEVLTVSLQDKKPKGTLSIKITDFKEDPYLCLLRNRDEEIQHGQGRLFEIGPPLCWSIAP